MRRSSGTTGNDWRIWAAHAAELKLAADELFRVTEQKYPKTDNRTAKGWAVIAPMVMLYGNVVECLLKGLYLRRGNLLIEEHKSEEGDETKLKFTQRHGNHDLVAIARDPNVRFELSEDERALLQRLRVYIRYAGRYPVPLKWDESKQVLRTGTGKEISRSILWSDGYKRPLDAIITRLFDELRVTFDENGLVELPAQLW